MTTATEAKQAKGTYQADTVHSVFGFSVLHNGISTFRGTLDDVSATLVADDSGELKLEGSAKVESISIREPAEFRAHVLSGEFFDAENHPEVTFTSTQVELGDDGSAKVTGNLEIAGTSREVTATGAYKAPIEGVDGERTAFELETTFDRRDYGFDWQMEMPNGGNILEWEVTLNIHLELIQPKAQD
jgi:polyisoprenoid-binding protein YceI